MITGFGVKNRRTRFMERTLRTTLEEKQAKNSAARYSRTKGRYVFETNINTFGVVLFYSIVEIKHKRLVVPK